MKRFKGFFQKTSIYQWICAIFFVLCISIAFFSFLYYSQLQDAIREESRDYLQEISNRIASNLDRTIEDNYSALYAVTGILQQFDADSFAEVAPIVQEHQTHWNYKSTFFIDENGVGYNSAGKEVALNNDTYFDAILKKQAGISTSQMIDNEECILLVVPLDNMMIEGKRMIGFAASYLPSYFEQPLAMSSFEGQAYSCVIGPTGSIVIRSKAEHTIKFGYNVLSTIASSELDDNDNIDTVKENMRNDKSGQIGFTMDGVRYYMVHTPVNPEGWSLLTFVPSVVVNLKSDMLLRTTLLLCGLITFAFAGLIVMLVVTFYRNKHNLEQIAYVDEVTSGHTIQKFYTLAQAAVDAPDRPQYALAFSNLQKFKLLNEQWGRPVGDHILRMFHNVIQKDLHGKECIGRISADNFCMLLEYEDEAALLRRIELWYHNAELYMLEVKPTWSLPSAEFGVFVINDNTLPFPQIIDRAKLALREFSKMINSKVRYAIYSDEAHKRLFREKDLEDKMEQALLSNEFEVYLQPKYEMPDQKIGGAEALVRWISKDEGMIYPSEFIPLFEKNGFIIQLDLWVFEQVCKRLRMWIDAGHKPIKVSVNCSRVQLGKADFLNAYRDLLDRYQVPPELLEIELTESVVMEDVERLTKIIEDIHDIGCGCSMDDFGSGYSSLNLIQSIPVDTLKLDKIFFHGSTKDSSRMKSVVGSIVGMAKALSMATVAEGVEYGEQVTMLQDIGCNYIQGYVFAKPMPISAFEELAFSLPQQPKQPQPPQ